MPARRTTRLIGWCASAVLLLPASGSAERLDEALALKERAGQTAAAAQQRIDALDDATREALFAYRAASEELAALAVENEQLERTVASQAETRASLARQIEEVEVTKRRISPLLEDMVRVLEEFVALDRPFLREERALRLQALAEERARADVSLAVKFRHVLDAYQIEAAYGRTISADRSTLSLDGAATTVDVLRFGRVGLYYLTLDGERAGTWDPAVKAWVPLADSYRRAVAEGLAMARRERPPDLVALPIFVGGAGETAE